MKPTNHTTDPNAADFALVIEDLTRILIRLPSIEKLSFTTLSVLHTLSRKSPMRLTELTATEQVTQSAITQLVTRLERDGLVERRPDPHDGRVVQVHITALGAEVIDSRRLDRMAQLAKLMEGLTLEEREAITSALPALRHLVELGNHS
ncbi:MULTISPECIES: MarR family winged helix-turn-helix transcriptional regulator [Paenibacillus]|uniref:MarR family winged helix-turn-helix transcriptional regulator n=1 Tax=Paenibacillus TaxID=44249 RepID=UPI0022B892BE|nr:MarR family transcriptional regulator [Paenibacillus caseinilyticus]MCZ8519604.1 MarR family transcriptional regulator [Paenibacillus caseinilyticus]